MKKDHKNYNRNRKIIEENMTKHNMTLFESIIDFCDSHEIPYDKIRQHFDTGMINKIKQSLKSYFSETIKREPIFLGFIKEKTNKS